MKNTIKLLLAVLISTALLTACKSDKSSTGDETVVTTNKHVSANYDAINFAKGGVYLDLNIGDSKETVKSKLSSLDLADEDEGGMWFEKDADNYLYTVDTYFEDGKLYSVDVFVYFYDADNNYDSQAAVDLYTDWKTDFTATYGTTDEEIDDEYVFSVWNDGKIELEAGHDDEKAYIYMYSLD